MLIDFGIKLVNYLNVKKANIVPPINGKEKDFYLDEPLVFDPIKLNGGEFIIKSNIIIMDGVFILVAIVCFCIQAIMNSNDSLIYIHVGALLITRAYLKLPFAVVLVSFSINVKAIKHQANQIFPKKD